MTESCHIYKKYTGFEFVLQIIYTVAAKGMSLPEYTQKTNY